MRYVGYAMVKSELKIFSGLMQQDLFFTLHIPYMSSGGGVGRLCSHRHSRARLWKASPTCEAVLSASSLQGHRRE